MKMKSLASVAMVSLALTEQAGADSNASDATPLPVPLMIRALQCERMEYAELDSFSIAELKQLYCTTRQGYEIAVRTSDNAIKNAETNSRVKIALMEQQIKSMEKCSAASNAVLSIYSRKYKGKEQLVCPKKEPPPNTSQGTPE